jgi:hypothetical protein
MRNVEHLDIGRVEHVRSLDEANRLESQGFVLLGVITSDSGQQFSMGLPRNSQRSVATADAGWINRCSRLFPPN